MPKKPGSVWKPDKKGEGTRGGRDRREHGNIGVRPTWEHPGGRKYLDSEIEMKWVPDKRGLDPSSNRIHILYKERRQTPGTIKDRKN